MGNRRLWRQLIGARLSDVAEVVGCDASLVHLWEVGKRKPSPVDSASWLKALLELERRASAQLREVRERG